MIVLASNAVNLARAQFATTTLYHFLFVPLTLGLGPIVATMQTLWLRTGNSNWLRLTHFFGALFLINFAIGVATGIVQEFEFGMNWSVYSRVRRQRLRRSAGDRGASPRSCWSRRSWDCGSSAGTACSPKLHLATLWIAVIGTWLSAYFILVANSWMQDPVGYKIVNGQAQLTSVWALLTNRWAFWAFGHTMLAGLTCGAAVVFGVCCWHLVRGRNQEMFRPAAKLALIVLVPVAVLQHVVRQPLRHPRHRAAADEDLGGRGALEHRAAGVVLALPDRRLHASRIRRRASRSRSRACSRISRPARSTARSSA